MKGRTIRLYLVDGTPTGILTAEIINFAENVAFASPSAAAAVIAAGNRNGRTYWKVEGTNQTYADWHAAQLLDATSDDSADDGQT